MSSIRRKNHSCEQNNRRHYCSSAIFGVGTAANSSDRYFDVPSEFAGGDQPFVPFEVPAMSVLRIDWSRFFNCHASIVALSLVTPSVVT